MRHRIHKDSFRFQNSVSILREPPTPSGWLFNAIAQFVLWLLTIYLVMIIVHRKN